jgi:hypothetical protein
MDLCPKSFKRYMGNFAAGILKMVNLLMKLHAGSLWKRREQLSSVCGCIATYSVEKEGNTGYGRLYFAEVTLLSGIPGSSEIAERVLLNELPDRLTYPDIQPWLFGRTLDYLRGKSRI